MKVKEKVKSGDTAKISRSITVFWCLFIGIGALGGGLAMLIDPMGIHTGMSDFFAGFEKLPFHEILFKNLIFSGISLICINCIPNMITVFLFIGQRRNAPCVGIVNGLILMLWICIQFVIFPTNLLSVAYFIFGLLQFISAYICLVRARQDECVLDENKYDNIGKDGNTLVVYFSRTGRTRLLAYERAQELGADVCEIKTTELTERTKGFWWCGRFGMHGWDMPLAEPKELSDKYCKVIICTPVWVFGVSAPVRAFCRLLRGKNVRTEYVITHFNSMPYGSVADQMDELAGIRREAATSVTIRLGKKLRIVKI